MSKGTFLYVGGFILPDKNAAAQRVIGIAKLLREIGYNVVFLNRSPEGKKDDIWVEKEYFGFRCYETGVNGTNKDQWHYLCSINYIKKFIGEDVIGVIAYNYPAMALNNLNNYCKKRGLLCLGDITEWYGVKGRSLIYKIVKSIDTSFRMRIVNKRLNGVIVISDYLEKYYSGILPTVNIPPVVDKKDSKWEVNKKLHKATRFVYAGSPSIEKERLDLIYKVLRGLSNDYDIQFIIIGITREQFAQIYSVDNKCNGNDEFAVFLGRIPHEKVLEEVGNSDYSIIIRDNNLVNTAGFPTKFVESISIGTAVIANQTSSISKYLELSNGGIIVDEKDLYFEIKKIMDCRENFQVKKNIFDYRNYIKLIGVFLDTVVE